MSTGLADRRRDGEESWISVSDLMAGLMMVFLFLPVIYAMDAKQKSQNVTKIVTQWRDTELKIHRALVDEFEGDYVGKCRSALTQGAASAGGCSALSRAG